MRSGKQERTFEEWQAIKDGDASELLVAMLINSSQLHMSRALYKRALYLVKSPIKKMPIYTPKSSINTPKSPMYT